MVNVLLKGRIGNNLFQIATGVSLAKQNNTEVRFYTGDYYAPYPDNCSLFEYLKQFKLNILRNVTILEGKPNGLKRFEEKQFEYAPIPYDNKTLIEGFFQSEKYFDKETVQKLFEIDIDTKAYIVHKYGDILKDEITSINVRRGDYFQNLDNHTICSISFFKKAINKIGKEKRYLIISDDINWCKKNFKGKNFFFVDDEKPLIDLYIQSLCTNNIISNSSFSWWGAWLNPNPNKIVICPTPWFGVAKQHLNTKDLIPQEWIKIENKMPLLWSFLGYYKWYKSRASYFIDSKIKRKY